MSKYSLVYSTDQKTAKQLDSGRKKKGADRPQAGSSKPGSGPVKIRRESKGRGGKTATILFNLPFSGDDAKEHMRQLQGRCACGASYKDGQIILQGDVLQQAIAYFIELNIKAVQAGG